MPTTIVLLADRPDLAPALAVGYEAEWPGWYGPGGQGEGTALADLAGRAQAGRLPLGLAAVLDGEAVGVLALTETSGPGRAEWGPWLGGFWVRADLRGQGIGAALIRAAVPQAARLGFPTLFAATASAVSLFKREGWTLLQTVDHEGKATAILGCPTQP